MDEFFWPVTLIENCSADTSNHLTPAVFPLPGAFQKLIHKTKEIRLFFFKMFAMILSRTYTGTEYLEQSRREVTLGC